MRLICRSAFSSDCLGEFGERGGDASVGAHVDPELVVSSTKVLHEGVASHDHSRRVVAFESPHWSQSRFEQAVVRFDPIVRVAPCCGTRRA